MSDFVPGGWSKQSLGSVARITMGQSPLSETYNSDRIGLPFFQGKTDFGVKYPEVRVWCDQPTKVAEAGAILFSVRAPVGDVNIAKEKCCIGRGLSAISSTSVDQSFLYQKIQFVNHRFQLLAQGSTFEAVNGNEVKEFVLTLPPLPEQKKIASILTAVDDVIESTKAQINKLKDLKTGMMQELLTKGIGHTEFKDSPVGRIPKAWDVKKLQDVASVQTGVAKNSKLEGDLIDVPYLRVANVQDGYLDLAEIKLISIEKSKLERFLLQCEDVLINEGGDFDKLGRGHIWHGQIDPCVHQNHVFVVRTNKKYLLPQFFDFLSGAELGKNYYLGCAKQTTNLASINSTQLKQFPVLLPSIDEQLEICRILTALDKKISLRKEKLDRCGSVKKALMQDLLTGKVRVKVN